MPCQPLAAPFDGSCTLCGGSCQSGCHDPLAAPSGRGQKTLSPDQNRHFQAPVSSELPACVITARRQSAVKVSEWMQLLISSIFKSDDVCRFWGLLSNGVSREFERYLLR